jgi:Protein of unknown function with HXXEE motif
MSRRTVLWLIPLAFGLHNLEEALFFPQYLPLVLARVPASLRSRISWLSVDEAWSVLSLALVLVTLTAVGVVTWATARPGSRLALRFALALTVGLLLNVAWHVIAALALFGGYTPGLATAVLINLPLTLYVLHRARIEHWLRSRAP